MFLTDRRVLFRGFPFRGTPLQARTEVSLEGRTAARLTTSPEQLPFTPVPSFVIERTGQPLQSFRAPLAEALVDLINEAAAKTGEQSPQSVPHTVRAYRLPRFRRGKG